MPSLQLPRTWFCPLDASVYSKRLHVLWSVCLYLLLPSVVELLDVIKCQKTSNRCILMMVGIVEFTYLGLMDILDGANLGVD